MGATVLNAKTSAAVAELSLRDFLNLLEKDFPNEMIRISRPVDPARFEVSAVLKHLENLGKFPLVYFEKPKDLQGCDSAFPLLSNVYACRERCALALGLKREQSGMELSLEYARRLESPLTPVRIEPSQAPVKEVAARGEECDLRNFPIVRHHEMDPAPYIDMTPVMKHPEEGFYNIAFLRTMYKGPRKLGIHMSPRHNWQIFRRYESQKRPTPVAIVVSHHPGFYLGALNVEAFGKDDYAVIGGITGQPLRLVASETWGEEILVPADAEMIVEGEILPNEREVEAPFGEFTGYYGPQRVRPVIRVTAITHRRQAILQHAFVGHRDNWILGESRRKGRYITPSRALCPRSREFTLPCPGAAASIATSRLTRGCRGKPSRPRWPPLAKWTLSRTSLWWIPTSIPLTNRKSCSPSPPGHRRAKRWISSRPSKETRWTPRRATICSPTNC